jgi:hypothetical protein
MISSITIIYLCDITDKRVIFVMNRFVYLFKITQNLAIINEFCLKSNLKRKLL